VGGFFAVCQQKELEMGNLKLEMPSNGVLCLLRQAQHK